MHVTIYLPDYRKLWFKYTNSIVNSKQIVNNIL